MTLYIGTIPAKPGAPLPHRYSSRADMPNDSFRIATTADHVYYALGDDYLPRPARNTPTHVGLIEALKINGRWSYSASAWLFGPSPPGPITTDPIRIATYNFSDDDPTQQQANTWWLAMEEQRALSSIPLAPSSTKDARL